LYYSLFYFSGVFALIIAIGALKHTQSFLSKSEFKYFFMCATLGSAAVVFLSVVVLTYAGVIAPWSGRYVPLQFSIAHEVTIK
jgi:dolichyl-diphosphooligosaccharide--protein glycosyltransferase